MYKEFSYYYDLLTFDIDYDKYASNIFKILQDHGIESGRMLEIACGSGNLTKRLAQKDFDILAFDNSLEMLNMAYDKLIDYGNVELISQDMFEFPYEDFEFDVVVSLLDVINYVIEEDKLEKLFSSIYSSLKKGGAFIFDLNSEYKLKEVLGNKTYVYEKDNVFYTWENSLQGDLVYFDLNFFVKENGLYSRFREEQVERYYPIEFIVNLLEKIGFSDITYVDEDGANGYKEKATQRILFKAIKL
ncbi:MAG: class I SAM-dependent methyltransferase [Tissierellia bacterium]|nr:class I SAM-dependent methyltransferase [Tissierellia bacterium]